jgi:hypothetical protein
LGDNRTTRIQLRGRLAVELDGREHTQKLPGGQARVLFTYLTITRALPSSRDQLIEALCAIHLQIPADAWIDEAAEEAIHHAEAAIAQHDWARGWGPSLIAMLAARRGFLSHEDLPWADEYPPAPG